MPGTIVYTKSGCTCATQSECVFPSHQHQTYAKPAQYVPFPLTLALKLQLSFLCKHWVGAPGLAGRFVNC